MTRGMKSYEILCSRIIFQLNFTTKIDDIFMNSMKKLNHEFFSLKFLEFQKYLFEFHISPICYPSMIQGCKICDFS